MRKQVEQAVAALAQHHEQWALLGQLADQLTARLEALRAGSYPSGAYTMLVETIAEHTGAAPAVDKSTWDALLCLYAPETAVRYLVVSALQRRVAALVR